MNETTDSLVELMADVLQPYLLRQTGRQVEVRQAYRGNDVASESPDPVVYLFELYTHNHGARYSINVPNLAGGVDVVECQSRETTFQVWGYAPPAASGLTTADMVGTAAMAMQGERMLAATRARGIGVLRISDIKVPVRTNEFERYEANPTFDVTITHRATAVDNVPAILAGVPEVYAV